jgi:hypothetical protein
MPHSKPNPSDLVESVDERASEAVDGEAQRSRSEDSIDPGPRTAPVRKPLFGR